MDIKKIYINDKNIGYFVCDSCGFSAEFDATKFKNKKKDIKIKCKCGLSKNISLEFRYFYRKSTNIPAKCIFVKKEQSNKIRSFDVIIKDLSQNGLRFRIVDNEYVLLLNKGDKINILFTLDNSKHIQINKECIIRYTENEIFGVQFSDEDFQKHIGFYLMN